MTQSVGYTVVIAGIRVFVWTDREAFKKCFDNLMKLKDWVPASLKP